APADGVLSEIVIEEGADVEPGAVLGRIADATAPAAEKAIEAGAGIPPAAAPAPIRLREDVPLPPGIRRLLEEHGLSASDVPVSGARLSREDILAEAERRAKAPSAGVRNI